MPAQTQPWRKLNIRASLFLAFLCLLIVASASSAQAVISPVQAQLLKGPFYWREKQSVALAMREKRKIPVSVTWSDHLWHYKGAGQVRAPKAFTFAETQKFEKLRQLPDHFEDVIWNSETNTLSMNVHFLSRVRHLQLHIEANQGENLLFRIEEGWFQGLEGVLMVRSTGSGSEVGIVAQSSESLKWVPDLIFSLAAEAVMHHVAESLRRMTETDYKQSLQGG